MCAGTPVRPVSRSSAMLRRLFILAAVVSLGLPAVRAQEGAASHAAVIQADTLPVLLERLERDPEDIDLLVEICSQYTMRSEFAAIHPYVSRLRRAGAAHDDERALMYADLFSGQSYLLAEGSDSTRIYLDRALIRGRQCEDPVALCRIYNALGIYAVSIETNYFGGIEYFLEAMKYARSASLNRFYLVAQCNLANTYYMRNDPAGLKYAEEVYRLAPSGVTTTSLSAVRSSAPTCTICSAIRTGLWNTSSGRFPTPINSATTPSFTASTPISSMRRATMRAPNAIT